MYRARSEQGSHLTLNMQQENHPEVKYYFNTRQNKKYMWGPREEQDGYPSCGPKPGDIQNHWRNDVIPRLRDWTPQARNRASIWCNQRLPSTKPNIFGDPNLQLRV
jgi:hypothetical protein